MGKWKRKYRGWSADEAWFILTNLDDLDLALKAYARRFGIEEMFRDFKTGGYNLEGTGVQRKRLSLSNINPFIFGDMPPQKK